MRFLLDWRLWFSIAFCGLVATVGLYVADAIEARNEAVALAERTVAAQIDQRQAATRRINELTGRIDSLSTELQDANAAVRRLETQVAELRDQVISLGGEPVVVRDTERVVVQEEDGGDPESRQQNDGQVTTQSEPEEEDGCENRNPQGKCTDADPQGQGGN